MTERVKLDSLPALPPVERLALIEALWDSLTADGDSVPKPDWQRDVLDQRLREDDADPATGESWAVVRRRMEGGA